MTDYDPRDQETEVMSGPAPTQEAENPLVPVSLVATLTNAKIDQQIATAHQFPRSPAAARDRMIGLATLDDQMAAECIYSVPRGGKQCRRNQHPLRRDRPLVLGQHPLRGPRQPRGPHRALRRGRGGRPRFGDERRLRRPRAPSNPTQEGQEDGQSGHDGACGRGGDLGRAAQPIVGCVPKPVWRKALEAVESVMRGDQKTLVERRDAAIGYFNKAGVPTERILKSLLEIAHLDDITLDHLIDLNGMRSGDQDRRIHPRPAIPRGAGAGAGAQDAGRQTANPLDRRSGDREDQGI